MLEDPGTLQRCSRRCGRLKQCFSRKHPSPNIFSSSSVAVLHVCRSASCLLLMLTPGVRQTGSCILLDEHVQQQKKTSCLSCSSWSRLCPSGSRNQEGIRQIFHSAQRSKSSQSSQVEGQSEHCVRNVLHQLVEDIRNISIWYQSQHNEASHPGVDRRVDLCTSGRIISDCFIISLVTKLVGEEEEGFHSEGQYLHRRDVVMFSGTCCTQWSGIQTFEYGSKF